MRYHGSLYKEEVMHILHLAHFSGNGLVFGAMLFMAIALVVIIDRRRVVRRLREDDNASMRRHVQHTYPG